MEKVLAKAPLQLTCSGRAVSLGLPVLIVAASIALGLVAERLPARDPVALHPPMEGGLVHDPFGANNEFLLTQAHIDLLRRLLIGWSPVESGAPGVHPHTFGLRDDGEDWTPGLARLAGIKPIGPDGKFTPGQQQALETMAMELMRAFEVLLAAGRLSPGKYSFRNHLREIYPSGKAMVDANGAEMAIPQGESIEFQFTEEHQKLLRRANCQLFWINPKRPYGDMTYFEIDMAEALGVTVPRNANGDVAFPPEQLQHFRKLHLEMLYALQVYVLYARLEPGRYEAQRFPSWRRAR